MPFEFVRRGCCSHFPGVRRLVFRMYHKRSKHKRRLPEMLCKNKKRKRNATALGAGDHCRFKGMGDDFKTTLCCKDVLIEYFLFSIIMLINMNLSLNNFFVFIFLNRRIARK